MGGIRIRLAARARMAIDRFARSFPRTAAFLGFAKRRRRPLFSLFVVVMHVLGFVHSVSAVMGTRTPQGAIAWAVSLNTFPYLAVPAYWIFGDSEMESYVASRTTGLVELRPVADDLIGDIREAGVVAPDPGELMGVLSRISSLPAVAGNRAELLIDGKNTFRSIYDAIEEAEDYVLVQFYIIRSDDTGSELKDRLIRKLREGVRVYLLYDDYGSSDLGGGFVGDLRDAGAEVRSFMNLGGDVNRYQLNFRNHRKIVVVDGKVGFVGGHNVGDEYLGKHPRLTPWRDSHMRVTGPVVTCLQIPFVEDWHWATGEVPEGLDWDIGRWKDEPAGGADAVCVPSGPADGVETCSMFFHAAIQAARERVWIASPYFVPDQAFVLALQLAAMRGIEVRVLIPELSDSKLVHYSSYSYLKELEKCGVEVWRYGNGFLHQKVILIDDDFASIGSANLDNRSFRLNFEVMVGVRDGTFASEVEKMFEEDFRNSRLASGSDLDEKGFPFRVKVRVSRLLAPIQ